MYLNLIDGIRYLYTWFRSANGVNSFFQIHLITTNINISVSLDCTY